MRISNIDSNFFKINGRVFTLKNLPLGLRINCSVYQVIDGEEKLTGILLGDSLFYIGLQLLKYRTKMPYHYLFLEIMRDTIGLVECFFSNKDMCNNIVFNQKLTNLIVQADTIDDMITISSLSLYDRNLFHSEFF